MAKPTLPTKEELETLYHEKGHDALVWYAYRNLLRTLPALSQFNKKNKSVKRLYEICRIPLILSQWMSLRGFYNSQSIKNIFNIRNEFESISTNDFPCVVANKTARVAIYSPTTNNYNCDCYHSAFEAAASLAAEAAYHAAYSVATYNAAIADFDIIHEYTSGK